MFVYVLHGHAALRTKRKGLLSLWSCPPGRMVISIPQAREGPVGVSRSTEDTGQVQRPWVCREEGKVNSTRAAQGPEGPQQGLWREHTGAQGSSHHPLHGWGQRPRWLTVRPAHGGVQCAGDAPPQGALGRVAGVHAPCVLVIAPVQLVLKEISLVIVGPGEGSVDATRREAEVGDGPRESFLYVIVLKQPVSVSWGEKEPGWGSATPWTLLHSTHHPQSIY